MSYPVQPQYQPQYQGQNPYPQQPQYQGPYAPSQQQQFAQPQYAPPAPPPAPQENVGIDDFYNQPAASGKSISFTGKQPGYTVSGIVNRPVTKADIRVQRDFNNQPLYYSDRRPKLVMVIPLDVAQSADHPDGKASWWVKGQAATELARAMNEAGANGSKPPEAGSRIDITFAGQRPVPNMNPQNLVQVRFVPPANGNGQQQAQAPVQQAPATSPAPEPGPAPVLDAQGQPFPVYQAPLTATTTAIQPQIQNYQAPQYQAPAQPPAQAQFQAPLQPQAPQGVPPQAPQPQPPAALSEEQQLLLSRLTGQQ